VALDKAVLRVLEDQTAAITEAAHTAAVRVKLVAAILVPVRLARFV
jgi:hypothetical protein